MSTLFCTVAPYVEPQPRSRDDVRAHWADGRDFKIYMGPYFSIRNVPEMMIAGATHLQVFFTKDDRTVEHFTFEIKPDERKIDAPVIPMR